MQTDRDTDLKLMELALKARENSYSPYSHFAVGAALLTSDGSIYTGCNVENASYGAAICAERTAMVKAVSEGHTKFSAIAICGGTAGKTPDNYAYPCGICRQFMTEFADDSMQVIVFKTRDDSLKFPLKELFPGVFKL